MKQKYCLNNHQKADFNLVNKDNNKKQDTITTFSHESDDGNSVKMNIVHPTAGDEKSNGNINLAEMTTNKGNEKGPRTLNKQSTSFLAEVSQVSVENFFFMWKKKFFDCFNLFRSFSKWIKTAN